MYNKGNDLLENNTEKVFYTIASPLFTSTT